MDNQTPMQKALEMINSPTAGSVYDEYSIPGKEAFLHGLTIANLILQELLHEERKAIEQAFDDGWSKCYERHPRIDAGNKYFNNTYCNEKTT